MIQERFEDVKKKVQAKVIKRDMILSDIEKKKEDILRVKGMLELKKQARSLLELFVRGTEKRIKDYMEPLINTGLFFIFEQPLSFFLHFSSRRNQLEIDFVILRNDEQKEEYLKYCEDAVKYEKKLESFVREHTEINDTFGGAVNQVLGVLLKFIVAELLKIEGPILLDEPTSMVSEAYAGRLGNLIQSMSLEYHRQYIYITHSASLAACADKKYTVDLMNGVSVVTEMMNDE